MNDELVTKLSRLIDRTEIFDLVRYERFCRDQRDWKGLIDSYVPKAPIRTTWFVGTIEEFAEASNRKMSGPDSTSPKHWIFPTKLQINGARALVESPALIFDRMTFDDVEFDSFQYCRFFSRVMKTELGWRLASFEPIYQRDQMQPVDLSQAQPLDWERLKTLRKSYRFFAYIQHRRGFTVDPELLGEDRPDVVEAFYAREQQWLKTGA
jgi:SnoaL-like domain